MILVTGGAGYIGSHTCVELINAGYDVLVFDNFSNSSDVSLKRIEQITGKRVTYVKGDVRSKKQLHEVFDNYEISAVLHFAGLKSVGESVAFPLMYFDNNVSGTVSLCEVMSEYGCKQLVFSSSATVYGQPESVPIREDFALSATNPYGYSKLVVEEILRALRVSDSGWSITMLRYFNPVGAHPSGLIGEDPNGIPNNLMPFISQVAVEKRDVVNVFGGDYPTRDGTGVRDYIHVVDLAKGHVKALMAMNQPGELVVNLGTGNGYSVLEMIHAFEKASKRAVPYKIVDRRPGDVAECYSDPSLAFERLGWKAELSIDDMCEDAWRWQSLNPCGYQ